MISGKNTKEKENETAWKHIKWIQSICCSICTLQASLFFDEKLSGRTTVTFGCINYWIYIYLYWTCSQIYSASRSGWSSSSTCIPREEEGGAHIFLYLVLCSNPGLFHAPKTMTFNIMSRDERERNEMREWSERKEKILYTKLSLKIRHLRRGYHALEGERREYICSILSSGHSIFLSKTQDEGKTSSM